MSEILYHRAARFLHERTVPVLIGLLIFAFLSTLWHLSDRQSSAIENSALRNATLYADALAEFRTLYTSEVVARVKAHGIEVTHDYKNRPDAIPLPATLSMGEGKLKSKRPAMRVPRNPNKIRRLRR